MRGSSPRNPPATAIAGDPAMPGAEEQQRIQQGRIANGVASGRLTPGETIRLEREQAGIERAQRRMDADGRLAAGERARRHVRRDRASRDIFRAGHNGATASEEQPESKGCRAAFSLTAIL